MIPSVFQSIIIISNFDSDITLFIRRSLRWRHTFDVKYPMDLRVNRLEADKQYVWQ